MTGRSRRTLLRTAGTALAVGVAGCLGGDGQSSPTAEADVIRDTSFDGQYLVVELAPEHEVSKLNLIGPDGSAFAQTSVTAGETEAKLELLSIQPGPGFEHYSPGNHTLVALQDVKEISTGINLIPDLRLVEIREYQPEGKEFELGNLAFAFENIGSAPTWVYDVTYSDAPNFDTNNELTDSPGNPILSYPDSDGDYIVEPGEIQHYVSSNPPLLFDDKTPSCEKEVEFSSIVGFPTRDALVIELSASLQGDVINAGGPDEYTCSDIEVEELNRSTRSP